MAGPPPTADEFEPLPFYPFDARSEGFELSEDECATALFLAAGRIADAAARLKVTPRRLRKAIRKYARLQLLLKRLSPA